MSDKIRKTKSWIKSYLSKHLSNILLYTYALYIRKLFWVETFFEPIIARYLYNNWIAGLIIASDVGISFQPFFFVWDSETPKDCLTSIKFLSVYTYTLWDQELKTVRI